MRRSCEKCWREKKEKMFSSSSSSIRIPINLIDEEDWTKWWRNGTSKSRSMFPRRSSCRTSVVGIACLTCFTDQLHLRSDVNYSTRRFSRRSFNIVSGDVCRRISGWNSARFNERCWAVVVAIVSRWFSFNFRIDIEESEIIMQYIGIKEKQNTRLFVQNRIVLNVYWNALLRTKIFLKE